MSAGASTTGLGRLRRPVLLSALFGVAVVLALLGLGDPSRTLTVMARFDWRLLLPILGLTTANYLLRWLKFRYYLRVLEVQGVGPGASLAIFFSGLAMVLTPGKLGEWVKSFLLRELTGAPLSRTAPIVVVERLTDGLAMLLLAAAGLVVYRVGVLALLTILAGAVLFIVAAQQEPLVRGMLRRSERGPRPLVALGARLLLFYESTRALTGWRPLLLGVAIGVVSWGAEAVAFFLVLAGLGALPSPTLLLQATFILATATLVGSASLLPGGLGAAEGSITVLLVELGGLSSDVAVSATLLIRFCTLWYGVIVGLVALVATTHRLARRDGAINEAELRAGPAV